MIGSWSCKFLTSATAGTYLELNVIKTSAVPRPIKVFWWFSIALVLFLALLTDSIIWCLWQHYIIRFILQKDCAVTRCLHCFSAPHNETYWSVVNLDGSAPEKISIFRWNYPDDLHLYVPSNLSQAAVIYPPQRLQAQAFIPSSPSLRVVTVKP